MKIGMSKNDYGTPVSVHICDICGTEFTVCPAISDEKLGWKNCLGVECDSYDESRDMDKLFGNDDKLKAGVNLKREPIFDKLELLLN